MLVNYCPSRFSCVYFPSYKHPILHLWIEVSGCVCLFITLMRRIVMQIVHFKWKCEFYPLFDCLPIAFSSDSLWPCLSQFFHFLSAAFCATPPSIVSLILYSVHKFNNSHIPEPPIAVVRSVALLFSSFMADYHEIFCQIVLPSLIFFAVLS